MLSTKRKGIQSDRYLKKKRKKLIWRSVLGILAVVAVVALFIFLSKANFLQIQKITIVSAVPTSPLVTPVSAVQDIVSANLTGTWLHFFSKNNLFLYPKEGIRMQILQQFPRIQSVDFTHDNMTSLNVRITERDPVALACSQVCFYMDSGGFIYAPAPQFSDGVYIKYYSNDQSASTTKVGTTIAASSRLAIIRQAIDYISKMGISITKVSFDKDDTYEIIIKDVATTTPMTSTIYFNASQPLLTTLDYFSRFWQNRTDRDFDYIDLRYGRDIIFKMHTT